MDIIRLQNLKNKLLIMLFGQFYRVVILFVLHIEILLQPETVKQ